MKIIWNFAHLQNVIKNIIWASFIEIQQVG